MTSVLRGGRAERKSKASLASPWEESTVFKQPGTEKGEQLLGAGGRGSSWPGDVAGSAQSQSESG